LLAALEGRDGTLLSVVIVFTKVHSLATWGSSVATTEASATAEASLSVATESVTA